MQRSLPALHNVPRALVGAAWLTVLVSVVADVLAGSHPGHVLAVGVIAFALGVTRLVQAGRRRVLFGLLSSAVVAQPVLHAAAVLAPAWPTSAPQGLDADDASAIWYVLLTAIVIAAVGAAEGIAEASGAGVQALRRLLLWLITPSPATGPEFRPCSPATTAVPRRQAWLRFAQRRGPPTAMAA